MNLESEIQEKEKVPSITLADYDKFIKGDKYIQQLGRDYGLGPDIAARLLEDFEFMEWRKKNELDFDQGWIEVLIDGKKFSFNTNKELYGRIHAI